MGIRVTVSIVLAGMMASVCPAVDGQPSAGTINAGSERLNRIWAAHEDRQNAVADRWFEDGDFPRVIENLRYRVELFPKDYEHVTNLAWMLGNVEQKDAQLATLIQFRTANPDYADAAFPEAQFYFQAKAYAKVPPLLEPVLSLKPPLQPNGWRILAHSYERLGMLKDSLRVWDSYIALVPDDAAAPANRTRVANKLAQAAP